MNGFEAWAEWRRTGFPEIIAGPNSLEGQGGRIPVRFIYPLKEGNLNPINYQEAVNRAGSDYGYFSPVWWDADDDLE
jgi:hypothetical protein